MAGDRPARRLQHDGGDAVTAASSPSNARVFANQGSNVDRAIALRWNGSSWTGESKFPAWSGMKASVVIGKRDAWAFAQIISQPGAITQDGQGASG